jgi:hypothetical protein
MEDFSHLFFVVERFVAQDITSLYTTRIYRRISAETLSSFATARQVASSTDRHATIQSLIAQDEKDPSWATNALSSKRIQDFGASELLFRVCALFSHPESLANFPRKNVEREATQPFLNASNVRQQTRQILALYAVVLENLYDIDLSVLDEPQTEPSNKIAVGFSANATLQTLYSSIASGDFVIDDDGYALVPSSGEPSIFVDVLTSEYPLLSPSREDAVNWLQLPPVVPFAVFLCATTLALEEPASLRYMLKNRRLLDNKRQTLRTSIDIDKNFVNMLLPFELAFCVCRKKFPPIPEPETRKRRFDFLVSYSGVYSGQDGKNSVDFAALLQECYPETILPHVYFGFSLFVSRDMISAEKDFSLPAALTPSFLEQSLLPDVEDAGRDLGSLLSLVRGALAQSNPLFAGEIDVSSLAARVGMRIPVYKATTDIDYLLDNLRHYESVGNGTAPTDFELLDVALVWYTSRPTLESKIQEVRDESVFNIFLLPKSRSQECSNEEDPVSFDDLEHVVAFGNLSSNTCVNVDTVLELLQQENLETHRGVLNPATQQPLKRQDALELLDILEEYQATLGIATTLSSVFDNVVDFYDRVYSVQEQFAALPQHSKQKLKEILQHLFLAGMYMRGWKGPGYDYPLELRQTFSAVGTNEEYEYSRLLVSARQATRNPALRDILEAMSVYSVDHSAEDNIVQKNRSLLSTLFPDSEACRRMLSNEYVVTSHVYRKRLFGEDIPGFDISRFGLTVLSIDEIQQAQREGQETEETQAYSHAL